MPKFIDPESYVKIRVEEGQNNRKMGSNNFSVGLEKWWVVLGSNQRPSACKADALPN